MTIELIDQASNELVEAFERLIPQLSSSAPALDFNQISELVDQPDVYLFVYRGEPDLSQADAGTDTTAAGPILGMLTLVTFKIPTGTRAWIEDVVVDSEARGQGAGRQLVETATAYAKEVGAKTVDLTSRPSREAANRLYRSCGFELRETNVYRA
ncbi:GNAT family N-acetyltransferase [Boudabousia tangfeifanii]|uniref:GNAT family N-acetyltransferase n=1 Tax=Boudabousia tangfeifanii TaxID=1912795 RepID=A0A1D9MLW3_9ACTO|nr:GNAT family N-acetyltransferase [Boudabousia tangfeifanii]AOZ73153.1 GNAT family N-acetyltransferase [Boudabousia tangfeifanii]